MDDELELEKPDPNAARRELVPAAPTAPTPYDPDAAPPPPKSRAWLWVLAVVLLFVIGVGAIGAVLVYQRLPNVDGTFTHASLSGQVKIMRDDWGIPHIEAGSAHDAYFALGFSMAQDRLFQMEIFRRMASGTLSEIAGGATIDYDKIARTLMFRKKGEEFLQDPAVQRSNAIRHLDSYLEGVNFAVSAEPLPLEFVILGITPKEFTRTDAMAILGYMAYGFAEGIRGDTLYHLAANRFADRDVEELFPRYRREDPVTVKEGPTQWPEGNDSTTSRDTAPQLADKKEIDALAALFDTVEGAFRTFGAFHGSNSWVLSGDRSKSGKPILANDPHMAFLNPSMWYEAHVKYPGYENYGVHLALIPFPLIAHNRHKAWALTMFENDDMDLYRETFNAENENEVMYKGEWKAVKRWSEFISVRGSEEPVELTVTVTPHGPLITDLVEWYDGPPIALWWTFLQSTDLGIDVFLDVAEAKSLDAFRDAVSRLAAPGLNFSYADAEGNIAWFAAARIPLRPDHVSGKTILEGATGQDDTLGWLPFEDNPQSVNPERGVIVTANNMSTIEPIGPMAELQGYWQPSDRASRIEALLAAQDTWDIPELQQVQTDNVSHAAPPIVALILEVLAKEDRLAGGERQAYEALSVWDFEFTTDSVGATIYQATCEALMQNALKDVFDTEATYLGYRKNASAWNFFKPFVADPQSRWWDDPATEPVETRDEAIRAAFSDAVASLSEEFGKSPGSWLWGDVHTIEYDYLLLGQIPGLDLLWNLGPYPAPGADEIINNMITSAEGYDVVAGPSMRKLVDYGNLANAKSIQPTGNSGNRLSPHYGDQAQMFLNGEYRTLYFETEQYTAHEESTVILRPAQ